MVLFALHFVSPANLSLGEQPSSQPHSSQRAEQMNIHLQLHQGQLCSASSDSTPWQHLRTALGPPGTLGKRIKSSMLSTRHLCCSCSHPSPAAPVSTALGRSALSTDSPSNGNSTFASVHCMKSFVAFAMTADKLYREQRNTCPVQLGHCLCMLGIVLSLVCFFFLSLHCPVVCYCLWILLAMGDTVLLLGT